MATRFASEFTNACTKCKRVVSVVSSSDGPGLFVSLHLLSDGQRGFCKPKFAEYKSKLRKQDDKPAKKPGR